MPGIVGFISQSFNVSTAEDVNHKIPLKGIE
jgi:hypothetical protein